MSRIHLTTRIINAATVPLVRSAGPALAKAVRTSIQFVAFGFLGVAVAIVAGVAMANGFPWGLTKTAAMILGLAPIGVGLLIAIEQVRLTYVRHVVSVYEMVEPFEQRRPIDDGLR